MSPELAVSNAADRAGRSLRSADAHPFMGLDTPRLLDLRAGAFPDKPFLIWQSPTGEAELITYGQFRQRVAAFAGGLAARGLHAGDRVIIHMDNCPQFLQAWHACSRLGAVAVTTNTQASPEELAYFVEHSRAKAVITQPRLLSVVLGLPRRTELICCTARDPDGTHGRPKNSDCVAFEECATSAAPPQRPPDPLADNSVQYTSGTTSRPKGVLWTHANALWGGAVGAAHLGLRADDIGLAYMPLFHTNALCYSMLSTLWAGATLVLMHKFSASRFWPTALDHRCTWASMIPFANRALLASADPPRPHSFRLWGNAFVDPLVEQRWGIRMIGWWGMTETITQCIVGHRHLSNAAGAMGSVAPEYDIAVVRDDGAPVSAGEAGRLKVRGVRGLSLFKEYLDDPAATLASFDEEGWFLTGDLVRLLDSGQFQFVDREKDMLKVGGENVAASEVERVILGVSGVSEVAVVSRPHEMLDEIPVACVIAAPSSSAGLAEQILEACRSKLARFKVPADIVFMDEFPRAALNKIDKRTLRLQVRGQVGGTTR